MYLVTKVWLARIILKRGLIDSYPDEEDGSLN